MRRLFWMGIGAAAAVSGERWLMRTWRQAARRQGARRAAGRSGSNGFQRDASRPGSNQPSVDQARSVRSNPARSNPAQLGRHASGDESPGPGGSRSPLTGSAQVPEAVRSLTGNAGSESVAQIVGPAVGVVGALGAVAGRGVGRLASMGARHVGNRVRGAVEGGRADARARERELWGSMEGRGTGERRRGQ